MRVAIDIDQTINASDRSVRFFAFVTAALRAAGHEVVILSLRRGRAGAIRDLAQYGVAYDRLELLPLDFEGDIIAWKVERAEALAVDVLIDDLPDIANRVSDDIFVLVPRDRTMGQLQHVPD